MAITDPYALVADYKLSIPKTKSGDDTQLLEDLNTISRIIDARAHRFFGADASAVAQVYQRDPAADPRILWVADFSTDPTSIKIDRNLDGDFDDADDTLLVAADWTAYPRNAPLGPKASPWTRLILPPTSNITEWPAGHDIEVTAIRGWLSVPTAIKQATIQLTALLRMETPRATSRISEAGDSTSISPEAQRIIKQLVLPYRRPSW